METRYNFTKLSIEEFKSWLSTQKIARTILNIQQHHTWNPSYIHFHGNNHFDRQLAMRNYHVGVNGWADIGQHFTIFPDGTILTGRPLERIPACIYQHNANSICIENLGNFDIGRDIMTPDQKQATVQVTALLCSKFNLEANPFSIVYHHWFNLASGARNNGNGNNKSCPGTNFFGGNKVGDCVEYFIPLVNNALEEIATAKSSPPQLLKYVVVTASRLNIRQGPSSRSGLAPGRDPAIAGAVLRVYEEMDGWYRISSSQQNWVSGRFTREARRATVNASSLNVRSGPSTEYPTVDALVRGEEIFVIHDINDWSKIAIEEKWVSNRFLTFT